VILNNQETPLDEVADIVIREPIGETMRMLLRQLPG
jgi:NAD-dependent SIR2 family protein deacetylase